MHSATPPGSLDGVEQVVVRRDGNATNPYIRKPSLTRRYAERVVETASHAGSHGTTVEANEEGFPDDEPDTTEFGEPFEAPSQARCALLQRLDGVEAGRIFSLGRDPLLIGRRDDNHVVVDDPSISREHARITFDGRSHVVHDLKSRNGIYVQGKRLSTAKLIDGDRVLLGGHVSFRYCLTDEHQAEMLSRLYETSIRDALTGLYNRRHFDERIQAELAFARRHDCNLAVVLIDVDHFKKVNDTHGHSAGDAVLRQVSKTAGLCLRREDILARYGGEEFVVLLRGTNTQGAVRVAERLRASVAAVPATYGGKPIAVTVSAGCSSLECCTHATQEELLGIADRRLYEAKRRGRNHVVGGD